MAGSAVGPLPHIAAEVQLPRDGQGTGLSFDVIVSSRNDASKRFVLRRQYDDFERLHTKIGKPRRLNFPKRTSSNRIEQREQLSAYLRAVLFDPGLATLKDEVPSY